MCSRSSPRGPYPVLIAGEAPRSATGGCDTDADKNSTERCALEDALVLLNLQTRAVWLTLDAKECRARDSEPRTEKDLVSVLFNRRFRTGVGHGAGEEDVKKGICEMMG